MTNPPDTSGLTEASQEAVKYTLRLEAENAALRTLAGELAMLGLQSDNHKEVRDAIDGWDLTFPNGSPDIKEPQS